MNGLTRLMGTLLGIVCGALLLLLLAAGFIETVIYVAGWLRLTHALGMDSQSTQNYALSSGTGPMMLTALGFSSVFIGVFKHINCEVDGCWRPGHRHPNHGRPVCRRHYHHDVLPQ